MGAGVNDGDTSTRSSMFGPPESNDMFRPLDPVMLYTDQSPSVRMYYVQPQPWDVVDVGF
jgi:hypothetical protein